MGRDEITRLEPNLKELPALAALDVNDGGFEPTKLTQTLVEAARELGARVLLGRAARLDVSRGRVTGVQAADDRVDADVVVVAAGAASARLTKAIDVDLPLKVSPAAIVRMRTSRPLVNRIIASESREVRQLTDHLLLSPEPYDGSEDLDALAARVLADVRDKLHGAEDLTIESAGIGSRPMPVDEEPIIGFAPEVEGLYLTVMHSGVTLAAVAGRLAATEIVDGVAVDLLKDYRLTRFSKVQTAS